jgi:hypothetical protein
MGSLSSLGSQGSGFLECLSDGVDRGYFTSEQIVPLQRLCKRASKAATGLIVYLKTAKAPNEEPRRRRTREPKNPKNRTEPAEQKPSEPIEPFEPMEPMD